MTGWMGTGNWFRWAVVPAAVVVAINVFFSLQFQTMWHALVDPRFTVGSVFVPAQLLDFAVVYYLSLLIFTLQKRPLYACLAVTLLAATATLAGWLKYLFLAQAPRFGDLFLVDDALRGLPFRLSVSAAVVVTLSAGLLLWNFRLRTAAFGLFAALPAAVTAAALSWRAVSGAGAVERIRDTPYQTSAYYGFYLNFAFSAQERLESAVFPEKRTAVENGGRFPDLIAAGVPDLPRGNLHIIVVESLIDVARLGGYRFSRDPFPEKFRRWLTEGQSSSLSPIFGGFSADAEFEILCGLPVGFGDARIVFNDLAPDRIACLPDKLAAKGWRTRATVATSPQIFSLGRAYPKIGFERLTSEADLDLSDRDGKWIAADAMLDQVYRAVEKFEAARKRYLNYVVVMSGHFPFVRDRTKRPDVIDVDPADDIIKAYANAAYYNARAVERYVERASLLDADAVFVIVGDHAPILGANFSRYRRSGVVGADEIDPLVANLRLYETAFVVVRGGKGIPTGRVAHFEIPYVILNILSDGRFCRDNRCPANDRLMRPARNQVLIAKSRDDLRLACGPGAGAAGAGCAEAAAWRRFYRARLLELTR